MRLKSRELKQDRVEDKMEGVDVDVFEAGSGIWVTGRCRRLRALVQSLGRVEGARKREGT